LTIRNGQTYGYCGKYNLVRRHRVAAPVQPAFAFLADDQIPHAPAALAVAAERHIPASGLQQRTRDRCFRPAARNTVPDEDMGPVRSARSCVPLDPRDLADHRLEDAADCLRERGPLRTAEECGRAADAD